MLLWEAQARVQLGLERVWGEEGQGATRCGGDSPKGQEKQEGGHKGDHRNAVAQVVDDEGDVVVQVVLPLPDTQTDTQRAELSPRAMAALCVPTLGQKWLHVSSAFSSLLLAPGINGCGQASRRAALEQIWTECILRYARGVGRSYFLFNSGLRVATSVFSLSSDPSGLSNCR